MSWLDRLSRELQSRGVGRRQRSRILLELEDHIACEPGCEERLGDPLELAACFADELASTRARRSALAAVAALVVAALAVAVSQFAIGQAGGYPALTHGFSLVLFVPAAFGMLVAPQVALVAGTLAVARAVRRRRVSCLPAAEIELIQRRARVAVLGGLATVASLVLWLLASATLLPGWYLLTVAGAAVAAGLALVAALRDVSSAQRVISSVDGPAGDVFDGLPYRGWSWLRRRAERLGALGVVAVALPTMVLQQAQSALGGVPRGIAEGFARGIALGVAAIVGYLILGRVGLFAGPRGPEQQPSLASPAVPGGQLVGDEDRADAERVLRDSFAAGRLTLEELTVRVSAVHSVRTDAQLREALSDLPDPR